MAQKKPETLFRDAVLKLMDNRSAPDFRTAFMLVAHKRGIFHHIDQETYNSWFGRVLPLVTRAIRARKLKEQRAMLPPKKLPQRSSLKEGVRQTLPTGTPLWIYPRASRMRLSLLSTQQPTTPGLFFF